MQKNMRTLGVNGLSLVPFTHSSFLFQQLFSAQGQKKSRTTTDRCVFGKACFDLRLHSHTNCRVKRHLISTISRRHGSDRQLGWLKFGCKFSSKWLSFRCHSTPPTLPAARKRRSNVHKYPRGLLHPKCSGPAVNAEGLLN